ncbi:MAG: exodeoxyribonuclease VII small subunit [Myxococcales bacterium]|nr:exodeoxyribonuclease VII small subunit [Myxococcales bacterium]
MAEGQQDTGLREVEAMSLEGILERLGSVVERLERGDVALEESLKIFEEGIRLTREGQRRLDAAERKVEQLITGEDGAVTTQPITPRGG